METLRLLELMAETISRDHHPAFWTARSHPPEHQSTNLRKMTIWISGQTAWLRPRLRRLSLSHDSRLAALCTSDHSPEKQKHHIGGALHDWSGAQYIDTKRRLPVRYNQSVTGSASACDNCQDETPSQPVRRNPLRLHPNFCKSLSVGPGMPRGEGGPKRTPPLDDISKTLEEDQPIGSGSLVAGTYILFAEGE